MEINGKKQAVNVVVLDGYCANPGDLSWGGFRELGSLTVYKRTKPEEIVERAKDTQIVLVNKVSTKADIIAQLLQPKYIDVLAIGLSHMGVKVAQERGVTVYNTPSYSTYSVTQMVPASIFTITNRVERYAQQMREGQQSERSDFCYWDTSLLESAGKMMGIVGLGSVGTKVTRIIRKFGTEVYAYTGKNSVDLPPGIQKTTLGGLFSVSGILPLHRPLSERTCELIKVDNSRKMKHGAILINAGRDPLANEADVATALESGQLAAYGADVMCPKPPTADDPLLKQPNALITLHTAWATVEVHSRLMDIALNNVRCFLEGAVQNVVNC